MDMSCPKVGGDLSQPSGRFHIDQAGKLWVLGDRVWRGYRGTMDQGIRPLVKEFPNDGVKFIEG
jgi:hypothetical protein